MNVDKRGLIALLILTLGALAFLLLEFHSLEDSLYGFSIIILFLYCTAFYIEFQKKKITKQNSLILLSSRLLIIGALILVCFEGYQYYQAQELVKLVQELAIEQGESTSDSGYSVSYGYAWSIGGAIGVLSFFSSFFGLLGLRVLSAYKKGKLRSWVKGGMIGVGMLLFIIFILPLLNANCEQSNMLQSWGGPCESVSEYMYVKGSNMAQTVNLLFSQTGFILSFFGFLISFGVGALIGRFCERK
ncbi:hypothetical protein EXS73_03675 [Candidatus Pacearchaeota archaeon]|nr:hypothetical protein [Candidatus Pacearchaeota archaeon]